MKKIPSSIFIAAISCLSCFSQTLSPQVTPACGGYFTAGGTSLSWTMGETFNTTLQNGNTMLTQGFQQPYILVKIVNLKAFIQGFYVGGGQMRAVLYNTNPLLFPSDACDSITVELHNITQPYTLVSSVKGLLHTDGSAEITFPKSVLYGTYYLALKHRNALETWSKNPVTLSSTSLSVDFTGQ